MTARRTPLLLALASLLVVALALALLLGGSSGGNGTRSSTSSTGASVSPATTSSGFDGAALPRRTPAPDFTLSDQYGRTVSLRQFRGRVTMLAFLYSTCGATCFLIAQQIRGALDELQSEGARAPAVLIVSADPAADTRASVARFLRETSLTGRVQYLTGSPRVLRGVWSAYDVRPASDGRTAFDTYASLLLLDAQGRERVLFESEVLTPESVSHDIRKLQAG